jgi:broad-specificity NMP kinase
MYPAFVKRILIPSMSATGKSTLIAELAARGHHAVDLDHPDWSEYHPAPEGDVVEHDWVWKEDRVRDLLADDTTGRTLFISGCASNQPRFYPRFDEIVLLTAPPDVLIDRLATRTTNTYGKSP